MHKDLCNSRGGPPPGPLRPARRRTTSPPREQKRRKASSNGRCRRPTSPQPQLAGNCRFLIRRSAAQLQPKKKRQRFAAALIPRRFGNSIAGHTTRAPPMQKATGGKGRVRTGDRRHPVLCLCQLTMTRHPSCPAWGSMAQRRRGGGVPRAGRCPARVEVAFPGRRRRSAVRRAAAG